MSGTISESQQRIALLVMGVGRSGTSALTRVLNLLGAALPEALIAPGPSNERGYWGRVNVVALNEEILRRIDREWHDVRSFPRDWFASAEAEGFTERIAALIDAENGDAALLAIKDPRLCRLAPLYLTALRQLSIAPRILIPLRHPAEVVRSMAVLGGTDIGSGELMWMHNLLEAERATRDYPRVWLRYDSLLSDWRGVVAEIADALDLAWPVSPELAAGAIAASLEPRLRHFDADQARDLQAGRLATRLWQAAQHGIAGEETTLREAFDASREVMADIDRLFALHLQKQHEKEKEFRCALETATAETEKAYSEVTRINEVMLNGHGQMLAAFSALEATMAERDAALAELARLRALLPAGTSD